MYPSPPHIANLRTRVNVLGVVKPSPVVVAIVDDPKPVPPTPVAPTVGPFIARHVTPILLPNFVALLRSLVHIAAE